MRPEVKVGQVWRHNEGSHFLVKGVEGYGSFPVKVSPCDEYGVEKFAGLNGSWELDMRRMTYVFTVGEEPEPEHETVFGCLAVWFDTATSKH